MPEGIGVPLWKSRWGDWKMYRPRGSFVIPRRASRSAWMYTRDRKRIYDAEMQNLNHQSPESLELPRRSRFYQSSMDMDHLNKGNSYRELPEGRVLFICTFDPFDWDMQSTPFRIFCTEDKKLYLEDGQRRFFIIA